MVQRRGPKPQAQTHPSPPNRASCLAGSRPGIGTEAHAHIRAGSALRNPFEIFIYNSATHVCMLYMNICMYRACILHITNRHNRQSNTKIKVVRRTIRVTTNTYNQTRLRYLLQILHSSTNWKDFCKKNQTFSTLTFKFTTVISNLLKLSHLLHVYSFFCLGFFHTFFEIRGLFGFALFHRCSLHGLLSFLFF